jgi:hypothetical protein
MLGPKQNLTTDQGSPILLVVIFLRSIHNNGLGLWNLPLEEDLLQLYWSVSTATSLSSLPTSASLVALSPSLPYPELTRLPPISPGHWDQNLDMAFKIKRIQELQREHDERRDMETREQRGEWKMREQRVWLVAG